MTLGLWIYDFIFLFLIKLSLASGRHLWALAMVKYGKGFIIYLLVINLHPVKIFVRDGLCFLYLAKEIQDLKSQRHYSHSCFS